MGDRFEYADVLCDGQAHGRGAQLNPGNRFEEVKLHVLGEHLDRVHMEEGQDRGQLATQVFRDHTRQVINRVDSPDIGFNWSVNPYRGCEHGCIYCYARPYHEYLGFSCGVDFETKIMAKLDAPQMLRRELGKPSWKPETIAMSGVTDCYQPIESQLEITRGCLEVLAACRQPVGIVTKNRLILRDTDLLTELAHHNSVRVAVSVTSLNSALSAKMEPRASAPADRLKAITKLREAGVPVSAMLAPIIPGLNDREIPRLLKAVSDAGAVSASYVMLKLPYQVKSLFLEWLNRYFPDRAKRVEMLLRDVRGGHLYESKFGVRMKGRGELAKQIGNVFYVFACRYGLTGGRSLLPPMSGHAFRRPKGDGGFHDAQMSLFSND